MRLGLILCVILCAVPARADTATTENLLWTLLDSYVRPTDKRAAEAPAEPVEKGERLAKVQADLTLIADGFEAFADPMQVDPVLERIRPAADPTIRPFFKTRETSLDAIYRTLAVVDFTWARRFPEPPCSPLEARRKLLSSEDGLFANPTTKVMSEWMSSLLGPAALGQGVEAVLDNAATSIGFTPTEYARLRARVRRISDALADPRAEGKERARLYCLRAEAYENLAQAQRASFSTLTTASRRTAVENKAAGDEAILLLAVPADGANLRIYGAAVQIETRDGPRILTDAGLTLDEEGRPRDFLAVFASLASVPQRLVVDLIDRNLGLALGHVANPGSATLRLAVKSSQKEDLVFAVGHPARVGPWTKTSGLVTARGDDSFQTDASVDSGFAGGAVLNENNELTGLLVLRKATAPDGQSGEWPIAVSAEAIRKFLAGDSSAPQAQAVLIKEAGTSTLLTAARPFDGVLTPLTPVVAASPAFAPYSYTPASITIPQGKCVDTRGCGGPAPSRSLGSSYSGKSAGTEIGEALAPLVEALIFEGIPALFRKIGGLFTRKADVPNTSSTRSMPNAPQLPPPPKEPLRPTSLTLAA